MSITTKIITITIVLITSSVNCFSQKYNTGHELTALKNFNFEYFENYRLKNNIPSEASLPEELIQYYYMGSDTNVFRNLYTDMQDSLLILYSHYIDRRNNGNPLKWNHIYLNYKLSFTINDEDWMYVGYSLFNNETRHITTYMLLNKHNEGWKIAGNEKVQGGAAPPYLNSVLTSINPNKLYSLIIGEISEDSTLNQIIKKTRYKNGFDFDRFERMVTMWRREKNEKMLDYFYYQR